MIHHSGALSKILFERIDAEAQGYRVLDAFQQNGYFVPVDDRQVEALDEEIRMRADTRVSFVKLVPLVGG